MDTAPTSTPARLAQAHPIRLSQSQPITSISLKPHTKTSHKASHLSQRAQAKLIKHSLPPAFGDRERLMTRLYSSHQSSFIPPGIYCRSWTKGLA